MVGGVHFIRHVLDAFAGLEEGVDHLHERTVPQVEGGGAVGADGMLLRLQALLLHGVQDVYDRAHAIASHALHPILGHVDQLLLIIIIRVGVRVRLPVDVRSCAGMCLMCIAPYTFNIHHSVDIVLNDFIPFSEG